MKTDNHLTKTNCCIEPESTGHEAHGEAPQALNKGNDERLYLIKTKHLRVSSTKEWAKTLDQLRKQIRNGAKANGELQDHFC
jgi:hypothetical protein